MECIEAKALKSSFRSQDAMKSSSQVFSNDEVWCLTGMNDEDFPVEDLLNLDFSEKDFEEGCFFEVDEVSCKESSNNSSSSTFSGADELDSLSAGELAVPVDELENLEWLSQFVDDSSDGLSLLCPTGSFTGVYSANRVSPHNRLPQKTGPEFFPPSVRKARSKRSRTSRQSWSLSSPPLSATESLSTSSSNGSSILSPLLFMNPVHDIEWFSSAEKPAAKKQKRKQDSEGGSLSGRRCTHCQVQKTPQWRAGPLGPKTLCNACGVRFKSGRLFPEYRPACSPTFSQAVHSNSHRKVLEMRKKKEMAACLVEPGFIHAVQTS